MSFGQSYFFQEVKVSYQVLEDGIYLIRQRSIKWGVDHYGVLDIGNRLGLENADGLTPVVIHQALPYIQVCTLADFEDNGAWEVLEKNLDEYSAAIRLRQACENPDYALFNNNCEQFARYVVSGKRESKQLQTAVVVTGIITLTAIVFEDKGKGKQRRKKRN
jgi:hypothetical protein